MVLYHIISNDLYLSLSVKSWKHIQSKLGAWEKKLEITKQKNDQHWLKLK